MEKNKQINRRDFLRDCAAGTAVFIGSQLLPGQAFADSQKRPNVVLIVSDDHGLDAVGCYGSSVIKTPNLDRLAADGVRFTNAFCTTASCSASRSVILTGLHNHANGQYGHQHGYNHFSSFDNMKALPVLLSRSGYRTARIGKFHVAPESVYKFDLVLPASDSRSSVEMADNSKAFISADNDRPFFLYFCTSDPHRGGGPADQLPYKPDRFGNVGNYKGVKEIKYDPAEVVVPPFLPDTLACRAELAQYYQSISRLDQGVGRLLEILKQAGKYENTLIIYISDNGIAFPGAKTTLYEPGMNLPCIVRSPSQKKGGIECNAMITWADLTPTVLDFAGAAPKDISFHGRSFKSALHQIYASHTFHEITMYYPMRVVRQRKYKLIWNIAHGLEYPFASDLWASSTWQDIIKRRCKNFGKRSVQAFLHRPRFELYDLENDPDEIKNLADDPGYANVLSELKAKIKAFQERTSDPWIVKWVHE
jgi:N-sulfoglucosamine sulfohydrolase